MHDHPFAGVGHAGRLQLIRAFDLNHAQTAAANIGKSFHMAQRGNVDIVFFSQFEEGFILTGADVDAVDL
jgi:ABC-type tungstate transport system permease subunit